MDCPAKWFCSYKTSAPNVAGGAVPCPLCKVGEKEKRASRNHQIISWFILAILCTFVVVKILRRRRVIDLEILKRELNVDSITTRWSTSKTEVKRGQEKYLQLRGKLDLIATRLDKLREEGDATSLRSNMFDRRGQAALYMSKKGNIIFDASKFYDVLDTSNDGKLSFAEINKVMLLDDEQLRAFVASMRARMPKGYVPTEEEVVARDTFIRNFLDVLADAYQLAPTAEEVEELFDRIAEEVGTDEAGAVPYKRLFDCYLTTFLDEVQIYAIIRRFKQQKMVAVPSGTSSIVRSMTTTVKNQGVSKDDFVKYYPLFLSEVSRPDFDESVRSGGGLDVTFENLCLAVNVGGKQVNVVDSVTGRMRSNTMTAVMGGSGSGKVRNRSIL